MKTKNKNRLKTKKKERENIRQHLEKIDSRLGRSVQGISLRSDRHLKQKKTEKLLSPSSLKNDVYECPRI